MYDWLVVWNMNGMTFHSVGNVTIPTHKVIFFRGVGFFFQLRVQRSDENWKLPLMRTIATDQDDHALSKTL